MNTLFFNMVVNNVNIAHIYIKTNEKESEIKNIIKSALTKAYNSKDENSLFINFENNLRKNKKIKKLQIIYNTCEYICFDIKKTTKHFT